MLRDKIRCAKYRAAIEQNAARDFVGKVVLDVGCGTGILSCFAARAGARQVYAIEASGMATQAELVIARNGFQDVIRVINKRIEDLTTADVPEPVDVIVSEWMGCFLLFENMLESVLIARDRFLKPGGKLYPRFANMYMAPVSYAEFWTANLGFLRDVEGIDVSAIAPAARAQFTESAWKSMVVPPEVLIADGALIRHIDVATITPAQLHNLHNQSFDFTIRPRQECAQLPYFSSGCPLVHWRSGDPLVFHGFVLWFDCIFEAPVGPAADPSEPPVSSKQPEPAASSSATATTGEPVILSTRPGIRTHWEQDACMFDEQVVCHPGERITGVVQLVQNFHWKRHLDVEFSFRVGVHEYHKQFTL
jgi:SAM-dependent methyltransferase